jgi:hypothetical protein
MAANSWPAGSPQSAETHKGPGDKPRRMLHNPVMLPYKLGPTLRLAARGGEGALR